MPKSTLASSFEQSVDTLRAMPATYGTSDQNPLVESSKSEVNYPIVEIINNHVIKSNMSAVSQYYRQSKLSLDLIELNHQK